MYIKSGINDKVACCNQNLLVFVAFQLKVFINRVTKSQYCQTQHLSDTFELKFELVEQCVMTNSTTE